MGLVRVRRFLNPWEAELACGLLESSSIPARVFDRQHASLRWDLAIALGGASVVVQEQDAERAREILDAATIEAAPARGRCPECQSPDVEHVRPGYVWLTISMALLIPAPASQALRTRCLACGHTWSEEYGSTIESPEELAAAELAIGVGAARPRTPGWLILVWVILSCIALYLAYAAIHDRAA